MACERTAPIPIFEASQSSVYSAPSVGNASTGVVVNFSFSCLKAFDSLPSSQTVDSFALGQTKASLGQRTPEQTWGSRHRVPKRHATPEGAAVAAKPTLLASWTDLRRFLPLSQRVPRTRRFVVGGGIFQASTLGSPFSISKTPLSTDPNVLLGFGRRQ